MNISQRIERGMALAFFASAYAEQAEECGQPLSGEIMDQLPQQIDKAALHAAANLEFSIVAYWAMGKPKGQTQSTAIIYAHIEGIQHIAKDKGGRELTPELFGHYCAMQAMGHGVGLDSFGRAVYDAITVPYVEFGSHSLNLDYFGPVERN